MEDQSLLEEKIQALYIDFFNALNIDHETGIWNDAPKKHLRFSSMPHVGKNYLKQKKKILFIGLDMGCDEKHKENKYQNIPERRFGHDTSYNQHLSGTCIETICILKDFDKEFSEAWDLICSSDRTNKGIFTQYCDELPPDILSNVALTNIYKFVTEGRSNREGDSDRNWFKQEAKCKELLYNEINLLSPDVIWFQGINSYNNIKDIIERYINQKNSTIEVYEAAHPSARCPKYINEDSCYYKRPSYIEYVIKNTKARYK